MNISKMQIGSRIQFGEGITGVITKITVPYNASFKIFDIQVDEDCWDRVYSAHATVLEWNIKAIL